CHDAGEGHVSGPSARGPATRRGPFVRREDPLERGFVLVGVVMFVLALTILGLSLFSLSSYEAQFLTRSFDSDQAFYAAQSGIEHAKFVIAKQRKLVDVSTSLFPAPEVVYARAARTDTVPMDTTSSIDAFPPGTPISIRVMASVNGVRRMIEASYIPSST